MRCEESLLEEKREEEEEEEEKREEEEEKERSAPPLCSPTAPLLNLPPLFLLASHHLQFGDNLIWEKDRKQRK